MKAAIQRYAPTKSILGVCLGQQAIGEVFGGQIINLEEVYHGVHTDVSICVDNETLFNGILIQPIFFIFSSNRTGTRSGF